MTNDLQEWISWARTAHPGDVGKSDLVHVAELLEGREAFKAGMIAMMHEAHRELTGIEWNRNSPWDAGDQAVLDRLWGKWRYSLGLDT